jgi:hypothetical protein
LLDCLPDIFQTQSYGSVVDAVHVQLSAPVAEDPGTVAQMSFASAFAETLHNSGGGNALQNDRNVAGDSSTTNVDVGREPSENLTLFQNAFSG